MAISYEPLWRTLLSMGINKSEMRKRTGIATATMAKLAKNESLTLAMVDKICLGLGCSIQEVVEIIPTTKKELFKNLKEGTVVDAKLPGITYSSFLITHRLRAGEVIQYEVRPILMRKKGAISGVEIPAIIDDTQITAYVVNGYNTSFIICPDQISKNRGFVQSTEDLYHYVMSPDELNSELDTIEHANQILYDANLI